MYVGYQHVFYTMKAAGPANVIMPHTNHSQVTPSTRLSALHRFISLNLIKITGKPYFFSVTYVETEAEGKSNFPGHVILVSPGGSAVKNPSAMQETQDTWVWFLDRRPWRKAWQNSTQYSCLKNPMDRVEPGGLQFMGL